MVSFCLLYMVRFAPLIPIMKLSQQENEIHKQFTEYGRNAKEWLRKCQMLLPLVAKYEIWRHKGFGSIYEYAAKLAGMSRPSVDETLWVMRKIEDKPALLSVVALKGIQSVKPVANVATLETQDYWAQNAMKMPQKVLRTFVREVRPNSWVAPKTQPDELDVTLHLKPDLARRLEQLKKHERFEEQFEELVADLEKRLEEVQPEAVKTMSRHMPTAISRFVYARTNGYCAFPRCLKQATSLHHTQRWALEKIHDPSRLHAVCTEHERLAHHGLIENEEGPPHTWRIRSQPDRCDPKFYIDTLVSLYRPSG